MAGAGGGDGAGRGAGGATRRVGRDAGAAGAERAGGRRRPGRRRARPLPAAGQVRARGLSALSLGLGEVWLRVCVRDAIEVSAHYWYVSSLPHHPSFVPHASTSWRSALAQCTCFPYPHVSLTKSSAAPHTLEEHGGVLTAKPLCDRPEALMQSQTQASAA